MWVRSFLIIFAFHVGRVKGQTRALEGWRVRGKRGVRSWPCPEDRYSTLPPRPKLLLPRCGQGRDSETLTPLSLIQLVAPSSWELWLGRRERQLGLLEAFLG